MRKEIIPWKCHCCGKEFDAIDGGLCKKCGKPTCGICFGMGKLKNIVKLRIPEPRICRLCSQGKETNGKR
jgi:hypothetical protein